VSDRGVYFELDAHGKLLCILLIFVDDILILTDSARIVSVRNMLLTLFVGTVATTDDYVGLKFTRSDDGKSMLINQARYIEKIVHRFDVEGCAPVNLPAAAGQRLSDFLDDDPLNDISELYQQLVGSLLWSSITVRPDISFPVKEAAKYTHAPRKAHFAAAKRILKYLASTKERGLVFRSDRVLANPDCEGLVVYVDAAYADNQPGMHSTTGVLVFLDGNLVHHMSVTQKSVAISTAEAELHAIKEGVKAALWLHGLVSELHVPIPDRFKVFSDNMAAIALVNTDVSASRTRHIRVWVGFLKEQIEGKASVSYVNTDVNLSDLLTKNLALPKFTPFAEQALGETEVEWIAVD
jgi:hypothetical protein